MFISNFINKSVQQINNQTPEKPLITVLIFTYQQVSYIKECIESVLVQKTDFPIEIIIGEDESTDGTREICLEYAKNYPDRIRLFLHKRENVIKINGRATGRFNLIYNLYHSRGKYIALCDGDDYWTDPFKLQKQVDFLERNPDFNICHHQVQILITQNNEIKNKPKPEKDITTIYDLAWGNHITTCSCVFKKLNFENYLEAFKTVPQGDLLLYMLSAGEGKIKYLDDAMAVYRLHPNGIWSSSSEETRLENICNARKIYLTLDFDDEVKRICKKQILSYSLKIANLYYGKLNIEKGHATLTDAMKYVEDNSTEQVLKRLMETSENLATIKKSKAFITATKIVSVIKKIKGVFRI